MQQSESFINHKQEEDLNKSHQEQHKGRPGNSSQAESAYFQLIFKQEGQGQLAVMSEQENERVEESGL